MFNETEGKACEIMVNTHPPHRQTRVMGEVIAGGAAGFLG